MPDIVCDFDRLADDFYGAHLIWHDANNVRYSIVPIEQHGDNRYLRLAWPAGWLAQCTFSCHTARARTCPASLAADEFGFAGAVDEEALHADAAVFGVKDIGKQLLFQDQTVGQ